MLVFYSFSTFPYISYKHQGSDNDKVFQLLSHLSYKHHKFFSSIDFCFLLNLKLWVEIYFMKVSREIKMKARDLVKKGKVRKEVETEKRIHFKVEGETEEHFVIFDKEKNRFSCDCPYFSLKEKYCSHIEAVKIFISRQKS